MMIKELQDIFAKANVDPNRLGELIVKTARVGRQEARIAVLKYSLELAAEGNIHDSKVVKKCGDIIGGLE